MVADFGTGFADENALILYVYLSNYDDGEEHSVLTVSLVLFGRALTLLTSRSITYLLSVFDVGHEYNVLILAMELGNDTMMSLLYQKFTSIWKVLILLVWYIYISYRSNTASSEILRNTTDPLSCAPSSLYVDW